MSERARSVARSTPDGAVFRVLFVCTGNTCRSPMAEAVARAALDRRGWTHVEVGSAGTFAGEGVPAASDARAAAAERGLDVTGHRSRPAEPELLHSQDLILGMTTEHVAALTRLCGSDRVAQLGAFATGEPQDVPDPIGRGVGVYRETLALLERWIEAVLDRLPPVPDS